MPGSRPEQRVGALLERLAEVREFVAGEFDALLHDGQAPPPPSPSGVCRTCGLGPLPLDSELLLEHLPEAAGRARAPVVRAAPRGRPARRDQGAAWAGSCSAPRAPSPSRSAASRRRCASSTGSSRCCAARATSRCWWSARRCTKRLLRLLGLARWPMQYLMRHPGVIDELADERLLHDRFDREEFLRDLDARHAAWTRAGEADEEALLDTLRHAHHAEVFRTLVRDVEGRLTVEQVADDLSALADATLESALQWCWGLYRQRHRHLPVFAVIAYGKLGGKELGYGSDLDLVFLYDDADEPDRDRAQEVYGGFVRKLITWLTLRTAAGELFDIDTALRPNGNSGLLVTSVESFERYQDGRGSNTAWTWEHQALTRARFCAGDARIAQRFDAARERVLTAAARAPPRCARRCAPCARRCAPRARCPPGSSTSSTAPAA
jgi:glutamate-ammonia-ligase adenylyltransferase